MTTNLVQIRSVSERRKVWLRGKITEPRANKVIAEIRRLGKNPVKPIWLGIDSCGWSLRHSLRIYEAVKECPAPVYGVVTNARSGALVILQACDLRIGRPRSKYVVHYAWTPVNLRATPYMDTEAFKRFLDETVEPWLRNEWQPAHDILLPRVVCAGKSEDELHQLLREDRMLFAKEALEWGFIDEIVRL